MPSILQTAQAELRKHNLDTFNDKLHGVVTPGCPHCTKAFYTISQLVDHLAEDILPGILERAFSTVPGYLQAPSRSTKRLKSFSASVWLPYLPLSYSFFTTSRIR